MKPDYKRMEAALEAAFPSTPLMIMARRINELARLLPPNHPCEPIFAEFDALGEYVSRLEERVANPSPSGTAEP